MKKKNKITNSVKELQAAKVNTQKTKTLLQLLDELPDTKANYPGKFDFKKEYMEQKGK